VKIKAVEVINETITGEKILDLEAKAGNVPPNPQKDVLKMAIIARGNNLQPNGSVFFMDLVSNPER